jgi:tetratricopeptide (TPR) repeat protein
MMNLTIDGKIRNYIYVLVLCVTLIALFIIGAVAGEQDKAYRANYNRYQQAVKLVNDQKYTAAQSILASLDADSQASYQVLYLQAGCCEKVGDFAAAAEYLQKVRDTRPALLQNQEYLCRYGVVLYELGDYKTSEIYLQESLKYNKDTATTQEAKKYLAEITEKSRVGGVGVR